MLVGKGKSMCELRKCESMHLKLRIGESMCVELMTGELMCVELRIWESMSIELRRKGESIRSELRRG